VSVAHQKLSSGSGQPPTRIGRYEIVLELGRGGMGSVYLALARGMGGFERRVALKVCHPQLLDDEDFVAMFLDEARLAAGIHHPNVVSTIDVGKDDGWLYMVMDYVEGVSLQSVLRGCQEKGETIPEEVAVRIAIDACRGLHAAHELRGGDGRPLNLVHRDVSPHNLMIGFDGGCRVLDFGIAKAEARSHSTRDGVVKGKFAYMAPEQLGGMPVTKRADLFALGTVLWEMLAGRRLFRGQVPSETAGQVLYAPIPKLEGISPGLADCVSRALSRDPAERHADAEAMAEDLVTCGCRILSPTELGAFVRERHEDELQRSRDVSSRATEVAETCNRSSISLDVEPVSERTDPEAVTAEPRRARAKAAEPRPAGRRRWLLLAAVGAATVTAAGWYLVGRLDTPEPPASNVASETEPPPSPPSPIVAETPSEPTPTPATPEPGAGPPASAPPSPPPTDEAAPRVRSGEDARRRNRRRRPVRRPAVRRTPAPRPSEEPQFDGI
jgi:serine/threonine-protein kinase